MHNLAAKHLFLVFWSLIWSVDVLAMDLEDRKILKQEVLNELLQSDVLKQLVIKEIKLYEAEKAKLKNQQKRLRQNMINDKAKQILRPVSVSYDHIYGNPNAPISIVEFSDFECPYCRKIHPVLKRLVNESKEQVNWVFRHYPLSFHKPNAQLEAEASECVAHLAENDGFWEFIDALFAQPRRGKRNRDQLIKRAASKVNINPQALEDCIKAGQFKKRVNADENEALAIGLRGTPANILIHHQSKQIRIRQGSATLQILRNDIAGLKTLGAGSN